jgi:hypothetical protein
MKGSSPKKHLAGQEKAAKAVAGLNKGFGMEQSKVFASKDDPAQSKIKFFVWDLN